MRTREGIEEAQFCTRGVDVGKMSTILTLEVLLDIRDLLTTTHTEKEV